MSAFLPVSYVGADPVGEGLRSDAVVGVSNTHRPQGGLQQNFHHSAISVA